MTVITRIARLFRADIHGILDCLEDPRTVLKQAVREMEVEIEKKEEARNEIARQQEQLARQKQSKVERINELIEQIELCFKANDETLGRTSVRRKLETEKRISVIERAAVEIEARREALEKEIEGHKEKLSAVVEKMELFAKTSEDAAAECSGVDSAFSPCSSRVTEEEVEIAFLKERDKWTSSEAA